MLQSVDLLPGAVLPGLLRGLLLMGDRTVLFVCVQNAGRSLMAEAIFNADPPKGWTAASAGTRPAPQAGPRTGPMLREIGVPLPPHAPRLLSDDLMDRASVRVTMGCLDDASCPARLRQLPVRDWALDDPGKLDDVGFRRVRDQIREKVRALQDELRAQDLPATASGRPPSR
ncbi:MAG TPA: low molecular weight phosphatase family protein [Thermoplasmata archaeon]|nr:low molecular weight phosphatase family protein [Thermoplasmata archaeon]